VGCIRFNSPFSVCTKRLHREPREPEQRDRPATAATESVAA
jgi:hypothetical protein